MNEYDIVDLVGAMIDAWSLADDDPDVVRYWQRREEAFKGAFGLTEGSDDDLNASALDALIESCLVAYHEARSPFAGFQEAPKVVIDLYQVHGPRINEALDLPGEDAPAVCGRIADLLLDAVVLRWSLPAHKSITDGDLRWAGFDPDELAPDGLDYL